MSQLSFDPLRYGSVSEAKAARDSAFRMYRSQGVICKRWVLKNQLQKYASFGNPDGRVRDVYMLNISAELSDLDHLETTQEI